VQPPPAPAVGSADETKAQEEPPAESLPASVAGSEAITTAPDANGPDKTGKRLVSGEREGAEGTEEETKFGVDDAEIKEAIEAEAPEGPEETKREPIEKGGEQAAEGGEEANADGKEPSSDQKLVKEAELVSKGGSLSPSRSRPSTPPEKKDGAVGKHDLRREQRGGREPSRDRPLSRGDGRPPPSRPGPVQPPLLTGGPVPQGERAPWEGRFRPPFTPYGPEGPYYDGPYWGMNGPAYPGGPDAAFYGPRGGPFFPPGPFDPGMRPPMGPVDGPWGPLYPGMRPGPIPRALPGGEGFARGRSTRGRREEESSGSEESSSEESSSGSETESESESGSDSSTEHSQGRSKRASSRREVRWDVGYPKGGVRFDEFGRPLPGPGVRIVYDDFGRPIELDPYGRPLDPRRAAEYDDFMRHQYEAERQAGRGRGGRFGGRGWYGEGRGGGEFGGR
jgi:hypothetical protein